MLNSNDQNISNGSGNIQAQGNVDYTQNFFYNFKPNHITFYEQDIFNIIEELDVHIDIFDDNLVDTQEYEFDSVEKKDKNKLNKLSDEYFDTICEDFLPYFHKIDKFLIAPQNKKILKTYRKIAFQLKSSIAANRKKYDYFEEILDDIVGRIIEEIRIGEQEIDVSLVVVFMNYMYWNCDIGRRH